MLPTGRKERHRTMDEKKNDMTEVTESIEPTEVALNREGEIDDEAVDAVAGGCRSMSSSITYPLKPEIEPFLIQ